MLHGPPKTEKEARSDATGPFRTNVLGKADGANNSPRPPREQDRGLRHVGEIAGPNSPLLASIAAQAILTNIERGDFRTADAIRRASGFEWRMLFRPLLPDRSAA